jgi:uncharacterized membrane protein YdbT with pleckstrin-like domain
LAVHRLPLLPDEKVLVDIRPHWSFLAGPLTIALVVATVGIVLDAALPHTSVALHWVEGLVVAVPCAWLAWRALRWRTTRLMVTSARVVEQWGVVARRQSATALTDIVFVGVVQSLLRRAVGTGRIELVLLDGHRHLIEDVRKPVVLQRVITRRLRPTP